MRVDFVDEGNRGIPGTTLNQQGAYHLKLVSTRVSGIQHNVIHYVYEPMRQSQNGNSSHDLMVQYKNIIDLTGSTA